MFVVFQVPYILYLVTQAAWGTKKSIAARDRGPRTARDGGDQRREADEPPRCPQAGVPEGAEDLPRLPRKA